MADPLMAVGDPPVLRRQKEHCLVGIKGTLRRSVDTHFIHCNVDTDVIVADEEEPMPGRRPRKPEEIYTIIENFCLGRRRLELFGSDATVRNGWVTVGPEVTATNFDPIAYAQSFEGTGTVLPFHPARVVTKELPRSRKTLEFLTGASAIPKNPRVKAPEADMSYLSVQVGEDAYFRRHDSMGVADGVGGWGEVKGAKAALFSRKVMHYASAQLEAFDDITNVDYDIKDYYGIQPKSVLQRAYDATMEDAAKDGFLGSTTALLCILRDDELRVCTLGDCTLMVIRDGEPIFRTEEQQHSFNFPFQLGTGSQDGPADAQSAVVKVREGDLVILGSDGVFDNVFDEDLLDIVRATAAARRALAAGPHPFLSAVDPQRVADAVLARAREVAEDSKQATSPFQQRAIQEGLYYQGGKLDDATILTGLI
ncbi:hypothetical protein HK405_010264, partial [Cladochytrium tenue]